MTEAHRARFKFHVAANAVSVGPDKTNRSSGAMRKKQLGARHEIMRWACPCAHQARLFRLSAPVSGVSRVVILPCESRFLLRISNRRLREALLWRGNKVDVYTTKLSEQPLSRLEGRSISQYHCQGLLRIPRSRQHTWPYAS